VSAAALGERGRGSRELPRRLRSMLLSAGEAAAGLGASTPVGDHW
jgi:hypothetical protein